MRTPLAAGLLHLLASIVFTAIGVTAIHVTGADPQLHLLALVVPGLVALALLLVGRRSIGSSFYREQFGMGRGGLAWLGAAFLAFGALGYLAASLAHVFLDAPAPGIEFSFDAGDVGLIVLLAFGEEIGWRGYALPLIARRLGWTGASLVVGVAWAVWHVPGYLVGFGSPQDVPFWAFAAWVVGSAFLFTWFYLRSGRSVWTAVALHAGANGVLGSMAFSPTATGSMATFAMLIAVVWMLAIGLAWTGGLRDERKPRIPAGNT